MQLSIRKLLYFANATKSKEDSIELENAKHGNFTIEEANFPVISPENS